MNISINTLYYLNSERHEQTLDKKQSLNLVRPYKVKKGQLKCSDIGLCADSIQ